MCNPHRFFQRAGALFLVVCVAASAAPRTGEADVRVAASGAPCFTIAEREERISGAPSFHAISVVDASTRAGASMWRMTMPAERTFPLLFSMCVPYAGRVPSLPQQHAEVLEAGRVYEVSIEVRPGETPGQPRFYRARFCLARQPDGSNAVRLVGTAPRNSCAPR